MSMHKDTPVWGKIESARGDTRKADEADFKWRRGTAIVEMRIAMMTDLKSIAAEANPVAKPEKSNAA